MVDNTQVQSVSRETSAYVTAAIVLAWAVMVFLVRVYLRFSIKRSFAADDLACTVGMVCCSHCGGMTMALMLLSSCWALGAPWRHLLE